MKLGGNELRLELKKIMMDRYNQNVVLMCKIFKEQQKIVKVLKVSFIYLALCFLYLSSYLHPSLSCAISHTQKHRDTEM